MQIRIPKIQFEFTKTETSKTILHGPMQINQVTLTLNAPTLKKFSWIDERLSVEIDAKGGNCVKIERPKRGIFLHRHITERFKVSISVSCIERIYVSKGMLLTVRMNLTEPYPFFDEEDSWLDVKLEIEDPK